MPGFWSRPPVSSHNRKRSSSANSDNRHSLNGGYGFNSSRGQKTNFRQVRNNGGNSGIGGYSESDWVHNGRPTWMDGATKAGRRGSVSSLEDARVEAIRNGVYSGHYFTTPTPDPQPFHVTYSGTRFTTPDPKPFFPTSASHPINTPLSRPPEGFFESLYGGIGEEPPKRSLTYQFRSRARTEEETQVERAEAEALCTRSSFASDPAENRRPGPGNKGGGDIIGTSIGCTANGRQPATGSGRRQPTSSASASPSRPPLPEPSNTSDNSLTGPAPSPAQQAPAVEAAGFRATAASRRHTLASGDLSGLNFDHQKNDLVTTSKPPPPNRPAPREQTRPPPSWHRFLPGTVHLAAPSKRHSRIVGKQAATVLPPPDIAPRQTEIPSSAQSQKREEDMVSNMGPTSRSRTDSEERPPLSIANVRADMQGSGTVNGNGNTKARMTAHHLDHRTSMAFAAHVTAMNGGSPLRTMESAETAVAPPPETVGRNRSSTYEGQVQQQQGFGQTQQQQPMAIQRPGMYERPRRFSTTSNLSNVSNVTGSTAFSRPDGFHTFDGVMPHDQHARNASWSSNSTYTSAVSHQSLPSASPGAVRPYSMAAGNWQQRQLQLQHQQNRRGPECIKPVYRALQRSPPNEQFARLPGEVLDLIIDHVKRLHLAPGTNSCATCWMRDCCSMTEAGKRNLLKSSQAALYSDVQIVGSENPHQKKKYKYLLEPRMVLLRRSLRSNPILARMVRSLKVPAIPAGTPEAAVVGRHDLVASVVMACPNLERLRGFYPAYDHSFSRLFHALSTRRKLKDMTWVIDASPFEPPPQPVRTSSWKSSRAKQAAATMAEEVAQGQQVSGEQQLVQQNKAFLEQHLLWNELSHMTIHCLPGATLSSDMLLPRIFHRLPALQTMYLSHVPASAVEDKTLLSLPVLKKLTLAHCPGITSAGLSTFATHSASKNLESLTLIHINIDSLPVLVRMFSNLTNMTTFNLVQDSAPTLPEDTSIWLMPYIASSSLKKLHWDVSAGSVTGGGANSADSILARSIAANGFPALRVLRAPNDPDGIFQALCQPRERVDLPGDRYKGGLINLSHPTAHNAAGNAVGPGRYSMFFAGGAGGPQGGSTKFGAAPPGHSHKASNGTTSTRSSSEAANGKGKVANGGAVNGGAIEQQQQQQQQQQPVATREAGSDLHTSRLTAQARLESARRYPRFGISVVDEDGTMLETYGIGGFIGDVQSKITYNLVPDAGAVDERGGLVGMAELLSDGGEDLLSKEPGNNTCSEGWVGAGYGTGWTRRDDAVANGKNGKDERGGRLKRDKSSTSVSKMDKEKGSEREDASGKDKKAREGCYGRWNAYGGEVVDKKGRDRWWHAERGRWRGVTLS